MQIYANANPGMLIDRNTGCVVKDWIYADLERGVVEVVLRMMEGSVETRVIKCGRGMLLFLREDRDG